MLSKTPRTVIELWRSLDRVDVAWVSAGHPYGILLLLFCALRGKRAAILVRQSSTEYYRARLPGKAWRPVLPLLRMVEGVFRLFGRRLPVTAVGAPLARLYGGQGRNVLEMTVNPISLAEVADAPAGTEWQTPVRLLTVGRLEPEKDPETLVRAVAILDAEQPGGYHLTWAGEGRMRKDVEAMVSEYGLQERVDLPGFVPPGEDLGDRYRAANLLVHVSLTEGAPQVLVEAMAHGLPVVASAVGGVPDLLGHGRAGLPVTPGDPDSVAAAVRRLHEDEELRLRLAGAGLRRAAASAIEPESERVAAFLAGNAPDGGDQAID